MPASRTVAVIPARHASTRFPGKPLAPIAGRPMVEHVWRRCQEAHAFDEVWVATDDVRIRDVVEGFGGRAVMTSPACPTGTDRIAEVARDRPDVDVWVNVQGDEPLVDPAALKVLADLFRDDTVHMGTLVRPLEPDELENPNVVKAVLALNGDALYFSRAPVPHVREPGPPVRRHAHLGLYGYRRDTLLKLATLSPTPLEEAEKLEQLRALEHGLRIRCAQVSWRTVAVDVPEDVARVEALLRERG
ncbi:3-deoxy-manno-octulosonate cytidylyltransferase [Corallococcus praedator]|uniref:3-deoxy-manno-octulosonate cytidylyltransferase n=1 Tax=Corallococcus praedator TaxID=2316724 RepID=A0ABX9QE05_9BACT|nr:MULTISPECIES: 3-deoxy-manno-octulosonate cytidylyltransferase [Corallococcus]RKH17064.1 3-deoxy-manno-octulosonate cytidylyltransferase [Corallococcus sp. CA047B]RKH32235.1 3-deoxy-manno-octulosonate cytidylyltransferase [Corallococcus sp. CA031C]RKI03185.1 3-deoxy-manno-octulosonate cytidylyltransferase [Corallococcus praedator]